MQTVAATPLTFGLLCVIPFLLTGAVEYCLTESFTARCEWNELILIEKALFGRMELGKCVTRNFGHVGCQADVLNQLDYACSGLPECEFSVSDPSLVRMKPCPKDFTSYLDATYDCVPVIRNIREECLPTGIQIVSSPRGYITSSMATTMHVTSQPPADGYARGTSPLAPGLLAPPSSVDILPCPIEFRFHLGQRLNLTLLDFALRNRSSLAVAAGSHEDDAAKYCFRYAIVDEPATGNSVTVCGGGQRRERHVYMSRSNLVRVQLLPGNLTRFLLRFEVIGCSDPVLPSDMHARHHLDRVVVFCNRTTESFILVCDNNRWKGEIRNCSRPGSPQRKHQSDLPTDILGLPHIGMSIAIILGVAMVTVVYVAIIMVCVLHVRRWRQKLRPIRSRVPLKPEVDPRRRGTTVTPSSQTLDLVLGERTPIIVREKLTRNETGQRYSEVFQLRGGSTAAAAPSRDWPRVAAIEAFRYCRHSLGDHAGGGGGIACVSPLDCAGHWDALHDGEYEAAAEREDQLRMDVTYGVAKTTVARGTVVARETVARETVARETVARGVVAKDEAETVPVVCPPQRVYSSPDVVSVVVGRKMADGKCPD